MTNPQTSKPLSAVQVLDDQKRRVAALTERRTRIQVKVETDKAALAAVQAEAFQAFGTFDLDELRTLYRQRVAENDRVAMDFLMSVDAIEAELTDIERQIKL